MEHRADDVNKSVSKKKYFFLPHNAPPNLIIVNEKAESNVSGKGQDCQENLNKFVKNKL